MKKLLFLTTIVATLFASCQKEDFAEPTIEVSGDFTATFAETRTELDGTAVVWCEEDLLTIFTKTSHNRKYQVKELSEDNRTATFGYVSFTGNDNTKITSNYALYPYDADATLTGGVITTTLQSTQTYNGANGNLSYALMAAQSATNNFSFRNAGSLLRFKVSKIVPDDFTLNSIKVASASNNIAGEATINLNSDVKAVVTSNGVNEITLTDINYEVTTDVAEFYVAIPSMSFADKDLTVTFVFEEGEKVFELPAFDLEQGKIKSITYKINDAEDFTGSTPNDGPANNEIWYASSDGNVVIPYNTDAFGANIVSNTYSDGKGIITFDGDVTMVGWLAFYGCEDIINITLPNKLTEIGDAAFSTCHKLTDITIPYGIIKIGDKAFYNCVSLESVIIPNSVTEIGDEAFYACTSLTSIAIPDSVTKMGESAFVDCRNITNLTIGSGITEISMGTFGYCNALENLIIPDNVTVISSKAFYCCINLSSVTIGNGIRAIGSEAFYGCQRQTAVYISDLSAWCQIEFEDVYSNPLSEARNLYHNGSQVAELIIPSDITKVRDYTFSGYDYLESVSIHNGITEIGEGAFLDCSNLAYVTIPESVVKIGSGAFYYCYNLTSVTIPNSVTEIGDSAFEFCDGLTSVYCEAEVPPVGGEKMFFENAPSRKIYVPAASVDAYKSAKYWSDYASDIVGYDFEKGEVIPTEPKPAANEIWYTTTDGEMASVYSNEQIVKDYVGSYYTHYYDETNGVWVLRFDDLEKLWKFPNVDEQWFFSDNVSSVIMPDCIEEITGLQGLPNLTTITLSSNLKTIDSRAFYGCSSLAEIAIPNSVTTIGESAFEGCI